jgi:hypothetical protein
MDSFMNHWQEFVSLSIVGTAVILIIRSKRAAFKTSHQCSSCALMDNTKRMQ